ncbi:MAG: hypothetical protein Q7T85_08485 [Nitrosomonas sp.]|nr:hypothetical protein [Nitrosomonas sp.]
MIKFKKFSTSITAILLIIFTGVACSGSDPAEKEADRLEDRADQIRKEDKDNKKAIEKTGEAIADKKEDDADRVRKAAEDTADRIEDDADRIRKNTKD